MSRIFLSHSSANNAEAIALSNWLTSKGWDDHFLDLVPERGLVPGERWQVELKAAADRCEVVLFVVSPAWAASKWCLAEFLFAKQLNKPIFSVVVAPTPFSELPTEMTAEWQLVDLTAGPRTKKFNVKVPPDQASATVAFTEDGLARLKNGLQKAGLNANTFTWPPKDDPNRPPYRGMRPLEAKDAGIFFGRDAPIVRALDRLRGLRETAPPRLFVILGASGAGKSSFLRAGLLPRLRRDDRHFLPLPVIRPGRLAISGDTGLVRSLEEALNAKGLVRARGEIKEAITKGTEAVAGLLSDVAARASAADVSDNSPTQTTPTLVISIDQGEELFVAEGAEEARAFLNLIKDLLLAQTPNLIVLVTIRSVAYERLRLADEFDGIRKTPFFLGPVPRGEYAQIIKGPVGRLKPTSRAIKIEDQVVEALLADIEQGGAKDALPLLAFTLERLYKEYGSDGDLKLSEYEKLGRIKGAIEAAVERALSAADDDPKVPKEREARLALMRRGLIPWLAGIDPETKAPRRRVARLFEIPEDARPLIKLLTEQRLLTTDVVEETGEKTIEPAHEALLRQWGLLENWLDEDRVQLSILERVKRAARDWEDNAKADAWLDHKGGRLEEAERVAAHEDFAAYVEQRDRAYLAACRQAATAREKRARAFRRSITSVSTIFVVSILVGSSIMYFQWRNALRAESLFLSGLAQQQIKKGDAVTGTLLALEALPDRESQNLKKRLRPYVPEAQGALDEAMQPGIWRDRILAGHNERIQSAAFSPDGTRIVTASWDKTARVWDAGTGEVLLTFRRHTGRIHSAAFSFDGKRIVTASWDNTARVWDASTGKVIATLEGHKNILRSAVFSPDGMRVVTASDDHTARVWDASTGAVIAVLEGHKDILRSAVFSPDGMRVVTAADDKDKTARVWDAATGATIATLKGHVDNVRTAVFSPDGTRIVTGSDDKTARVWDALTGDPINVLAGHAYDVLTAAFSSDGTRIVTAGTYDDTARVWDAATGATIAILKGHQNTVWAAAFSPDGEHVITASGDDTARVWDAATGTLRATLRGHQDAVRVAAFSPEGTPRIVTGSNDKTVRVWDVSTGAIIATLEGHQDILRSAAFSPDGERIVTASSDGTVRVWDAATGAVMTILKGHQGKVWTAAFSPDGERIVTTSSDRTARVWDTATGATIATLEGHKHTVLSAAFSPDGKRIVTASSDKTAVVWDAATSDISFVLEGHRDSVRSAAFSPDGTRIVTASKDQTARVWDAATGARLVTLTGRRQDLRREMWMAAFSPDGTRVITTASWSKTPRVWDAATGAILATLEGHEEMVRSAAFSPDGKRIITGSDDKTARVWDADMGAVIATLKGHGNIVRSAAFSSDGKRIVTASSDRTARVWHAPPHAQTLIWRAKGRLSRCLTRGQRKRFHLDNDPPSWCYTPAKWPFEDPAKSWPKRPLREAFDTLIARFKKARDSIESASAESP